MDIIPEQYLKYKAAAKTISWYDHPFISKDERPIYYDLFRWEERDTGWDHNCCQYEKEYFGYLNEDKFDTIEKKIAYLQGIFEIYGNESNCLRFANSSQTVERVKNWINDVTRKYLGNSYLCGLEKHEILYMIPICHSVWVEPGVANFIRNFKFKE